MLGAVRSVELRDRSVASARMWLQKQRVQRAALRVLKGPSDTLRCIWQWVVPDDRLPREWRWYYMSATPLGARCDSQPSAVVKCTEEGAGKDEDSTKDRDGGKLFAGEDADDRGPDRFPCVDDGRAGR